MFVPIGFWCKQTPAHGKFLVEMGEPDGMVATRLGSFHHRHPLIVIAEEGEVQVRAAAVRLGADGQLAEQPTHRLCVAAILGVHNSVFESGGDRAVLSCTGRGLLKKTQNLPV